MESELDRYPERLASVLGHADRRAGLRDYCRGLMLPIHRKSVEPLAAHIEPQRVRAKHQSLHHFVTVQTPAPRRSLFDDIERPRRPRKHPSTVAWVVDRFRRR